VRQRITGCDSPIGRYKIDAEFVGRVFEQYVMPLTKEVEVEYLLQRLDILYDFKSDSERALKKARA
jgi:hypothetical protein